VAGACPHALDTKRRAICESVRSIFVVTNSWSTTQRTIQTQVAKLLPVLSKIAAKIGTLAEDGVYVPVDPATKQTMGWGR
jgi:hypothetical protein